MSSEANKELVRQYVELWDIGNLALADEVLAANFVDHTHPEFVIGPEGVKQAVQGFREGFPDATITVEQMICEGDVVALRGVIHATHLGMYAGFPPTGKALALVAMDFIRIEDGKLVELWSCQDTLNWVLQLGARFQ